MKKLSVIGIGAGDPDYLTIQAVKALNRVDVFFLMDKGPAKQTLVDLRREICQRYIVDRTYRFVEAYSPERQRGDVDYAASVEDLNRAKQATFERLIDEQLSDGQCGGFLVWGDPSLYDSTVRILQSILDAGRCAFEFEVIAGITSVQALAAQHKVPLNSIGGSLEITTGRRLAAGQVGDSASVVVMLDAEDAYRQVSDPDTHIYWGAYVGTPDQILIAGRLEEVAESIERTRKAARQANGWIMDTYLLRKP
ncbi:precorrin-6A synthase (deacetylating) [Pseudomonas sp. Fig-3]|jgi:precorrin-6A synthase|uniref:precorrin-6A synthase (deacetylating) n=1 Tax=Pseudomonas TaxID=286 RepID=UPI001112187F|nr:MULTISPECIES: precorrin-6A synthase (deacetylating) [unclassified Pseudomonas]MBD0703292.1 precorrin-6A synthase (deacetylating) [Pseudomonas sp. PSB1]MDD2032605.1 precorrin-6A synthase (deacetylating) [Pseudomonas sp. 39167]MDR8387563.1 precorrin-6A synthase (deacetylating) [Pseudomonas sp. JL2]MEA1028251.1 precorrin-6A synthase (deacetylating) [Pseudomonas sp. N-137]MXR28555.1 precorrin-6A synthase (deacetylating) [Pseudomonas sp. PICF6]